MPKPKALEEYQEKVRQEKKQFKECFGTPAGKEVLRKLREEFYDIALDPESSLEFQVGQRDVVFQILNRVES